MEDTPEMRISDAERQDVIRRIQSAYAEGRLDTSELEERLEVTHRSKVSSDLTRVVADLPDPPQPLRVRANSDRWTAALIQWKPLLAAPLICTLIYLITSPGDYYWPIWVWFGVSVPVIFSVLGSAAE